MGVGLEHLFAGIAQGVGTQMLTKQKEDRDREERQQMQALQTTVLQLQDPNLRPEVRQSLFGLAMKQASFGNKKLEQGIMDQIGPLIASTGQHQMGPHQAEQQGQQGQAPNPNTAQEEQAPSLPQSGMNKFGPPQGGGIYTTPQEQTQQMADRAGAIAGAQANATQPSRIAEITAQYGQQAANNKADFEMRNKAQQEQGNDLLFTQPDANGMVRPIWINKATKTRETGSPMPAPVSQEALNAGAAYQAKGKADVEIGADSVLRGSGIDPVTASPVQRETARQLFSKIGLMSEKAGLDKTLAETELAKAHALYLKENPGHENDVAWNNSFMTDYARQHKEWEDHGSFISKEVEKVDKLKSDAGVLYGQAMEMKNALEQAGYGPGKEDPAMTKQGYTWMAQRELEHKAQALLDQAQGLGIAAAKRYPGETFFGMGGDNSKWPYLESRQAEFTYQPMRGLPTMPTKGGKSRVTGPADKGQTPGSKKTISVPSGWIKLANP